MMIAPANARGFMILPRMPGLRWHNQSFGAVNWAVKAQAGKTENHGNAKADTVTRGELMHEQKKTLSRLEQMKSGSRGGQEEIPRLQEPERESALVSAGGQFP